MFPFIQIDVWPGETGDHPRTAKLHHSPAPDMPFAQICAIVNLRRMVVENRRGYPARSPGGRRRDRPTREHPGCRADPGPQASANQSGPGTAEAGPTTEEPGAGGMVPGTSPHPAHTPHRRRPTRAAARLFTREVRPFVLFVRMWRTIRVKCGSGRRVAEQTTRRPGDPASGDRATRATGPRSPGSAAGRCALDSLVLSGLSAPGKPLATRKHS